MGWLLSPFTVWNDAFVNIPLSYIAASLFIRIWPVNFLTAVVVFYWISNALGLLLMYLSGRGIVKEAGSLKRELIKLLVAVVMYSLVLIFLGKLGVLKPF